VEAIKNDIEGLKSLLRQVQDSIDKEDYPAAQTQAKAINEMSQGVQNELQQALAKVGRGKSARSSRH
jgi:signal transduction histidine kinase